MQAAFKQVSELFRSNPGLKKLAITYGLVIVCLIAAFLFNYFLLADMADLSEWIARKELSRLFFLESVSPYDMDITELVSRSALVNNQGGDISIFPYVAPVFGLFLYFPFSLIANTALSYSLWLTINQVMLILATLWLMDLFSWKAGRELKIFIFFFIMLASFSLANYLFPGSSIVQYFFLVMGIRAIDREDDILAGIALALLFVSPLIVVMPAMIIILSLLRNRRFYVITWLGITLLLVSLAGIIFDSGWPLKMIRNIFNQSNLVFLYSFEPIINLIPVGLRNPYIRYIIPLALISWLFFEFIRTKSEQKFQQLWILGLAICINSLIFFHHILVLSIFFSFLFLFIFYLWHQRILRKSLVIFFAFSSAAVNFIPVFLSEIYRDFNSPSMATFQFISIMFLVIMLYWVKWWIADETFLSA